MKSLIIMFFIPITIYSQIDNKLKAGLLKPTSEDQKNRLLGASLNIPTVNDIKPNVDLSPYLPVLEDQGISESCAAFSVSYAMTILINQKSKKTFKRDYLVVPSQYLDSYFSPSWIYNISKLKYPEDIRSDCNHGISFPDAFTTVMYNGAVSWSAFPYKSTLCNCDIDPTAEVSERVIENASKIYIYEPINVDSKLFVKILSSKTPVPICIGANIDANYFECGQNHTNQNTWLTKGESIALNSTYHALTIVGYDLDKRIFKVADSHGMQWGDSGFIYISFDLIDNPTKVIDAAYLPLLNNSLLGKERIATNGSAVSSSKNQILKWKLRPNRYSLINGLRVILISIDQKNETYNFQFKDDNGIVLGQQMLYTIKKGSTGHFLIDKYEVTIQPDNLSRKDVLTFFLKVDKKNNP